ncbi:mechanosensitive ion channel [Halomonas sp. FeN2]|uniref:Small-conductance mechanosensitive channel n=1 Tax=Vreelandella neptunia TaxID=115551 RepID=A0ABZ0YGT7_9GAMM|nr:MULTISPECIES: mechanosensitive ion channel domain-containing protein [Halomonas]TDW00209.1 small-conductance mechanosensitive channel [Halomonas alkaliantarctica]MBF59459.1 mechanosensitive ion channel protein MscS [Halomonas sp.]MDN3561189.1 mechanosensitive ion channel [Halomonas neptunia]UBR50813.1 mechanosensitive ion channel [Halomonas sp. FeN2]WQH11322.1 mechanosensitive ion channel [Halomonas neptunia]|tara:strand:+ start:1131 stop:1982 length:852 start_codon:yes stop_codon:yes gene_type:complete
MEEQQKYARLFNDIDSQALITLGVVLLSTIVLIIASQRGLNWIGNRMHGQVRFRIFALVPMTRLLILMTALAIIVPTIIEPSLRNMVTLLGALGLAIGFAMKDYVSSLIAGVVSAVELPYRPGDWVQIEDTYGEVKHVGLRTVDIQTPDDDLVYVPHLKLWDHAVYNANNGGTSLQCVASFYLHPEHEAGWVRKALRDVALTSAYLKFDQPIIVVAEEKPWGTHYRIRAYPVDPRQQFLFITDLTLRGKKVLSAAGVQSAMLPPDAALDTRNAVGSAYSRGND